MKTIAYIDGQNLFYGTSKCNACAEKLGKELSKMRASDCTCGFAWIIDYSKLRNYLSDKYEVSEAYYFLGYLTEVNQELYTKLQLAGFVVIFKEHHPDALSTKKGNVDVDLVFEIMKRYKEEDFQLLLVSGDGDYKKVVDYFISRGALRKIIFPNLIRASWLYKKLGSEYFDHLTNLDVRSRMQYLPNIDKREGG